MSWRGAFWLAASLLVFQWVHAVDQRAPQPPPIQVVRTVYVRQTQSELYDHWRNCEVTVARIYLAARAQHYAR